MDSKPELEPEIFSEPLIISKKAKLSRKLGNILNSSNMASDGWTKYMGNEVNNAPNTSNRSKIIKKYILDHNGFVFNGHLYTPVGIWAKLGQRNKVILQEFRTNRYFLLGESVVNRAIESIRNHHEGVSQYLRGMIPIDIDSEVTENTDVDKQNKLLHHLDVMDLQIEKDFQKTENLSESMKRYINLIQK